MYLAAAFTGLRMGELLALRWRDVDFAGSTIRVRASWAASALTTPKSGRSGRCRWRLMLPARLLGSLGVSTGSARTTWGLSGRLGITSTGPRYAGATKQRWQRRRFGRFASNLRHTFGTRMIAKADIRRVQEWMGHADIQTTMRHLHYAPRDEDAQLVAEAFHVAAPDQGGVGERPQDVRTCPKMSVRSVGRIACDGGGFAVLARRAGGNRGVLGGVCQHF